MTFLGFNIDRRTGNLTDLQTRVVLEEGIMQQNLFDALIRNRVNLAENFDALPRFVNLFIVKIHCIQIQGVLVIVFNPTFNNISDISWQVEETGVPRENYRPAVSYGQTLSHNVVSSKPGYEWDSNSQL